MNERTATQLSVQFELSTPPGWTWEHVHAHGERMMQELLELEKCNHDIADSAVSTDAERSILTVELLVYDGGEPTAVLGRALDIIRTAAHAAGGATPGWPTVSHHPDQVRMARAHTPACA